MNSDENKPNQVVVNTNIQKQVVTNTKQVNESTASDLEKTMESHMQENKKNTKISIDWKNVFTYFLMFLIVAGCVLLVFHFIDKYNDGEIKKTTVPSTTQRIIDPTTTTTTLRYVTTTTTTQEVHTVFDRNR